jgi:hypothetical protein
MYLLKLGLLVRVLRYLLMKGRSACYGVVSSLLRGKRPLYYGYYIVCSNLMVSFLKLVLHFNKVYNSYIYTTIISDCINRPRSYMYISRHKEYRLSWLYGYNCNSSFPCPSEDGLLRPKHVKDIRS